MPLYTGINGVVREIEHIDIGVNAETRHAFSLKSGINGVSRDLIELIPQINYIEIVADSVCVETINSNGEFVSYDGFDIQTVNKYGSIIIDDNYIQVECNTAKKQIWLKSTIYIVFLDGHRTMLNVAVNEANCSFSLSVTAYEYFTADGWYVNDCLGSALINNHVTDSETKTISITNATNEYSELIASLKGSGKCRSKQTFNSIIINDNVLNIKITSSLS